MAPDGHFLKNVAANAANDLGMTENSSRDAGVDRAVQCRSARSRNTNHFSHG